MRKGEIACYKQFLLFSQCFLPYMVLIFHLKMHFSMSSAICFNLDQSKILSSGNGIVLSNLQGRLLSHRIKVTTYQFIFGTSHDSQVSDEMYKVADFSSSYDVSQKGNTILVFPTHSTSQTKTGTFSDAIGQDQIRSCSMVVGLYNTRVCVCVRARVCVRLCACACVCVCVCV